MWKDTAHLCSHRDTHKPSVKPFFPPLHCHNLNTNLCSFSCSNCTERGRGWPCCVPNYLRTFPKIATETSLLVRDCTRFCLFLLARVFKYVPTLTFCSFHHTLSLSLLSVLFLSSWNPFFSLCQLFVCLSQSVILPPFSCLFCPSADDATRVILKSTDDYINANYINVSLVLLVFPLSSLHQYAFGSFEPWWVVCFR